MTHLQACRARVHTLKLSWTAFRAAVALATMSNALGSAAAPGGLNLKENVREPGADQYSSAK